uniref:Uncharacterized protein n=1 Tax=Glossina brevipalpis TaxID=37001 RepID=A0A1A9X275_9MUSC
MLLTSITFLVIIFTANVNAEKETSNQEVNSKVNWLPVWNDIEGDREDPSGHHQEKDMCNSFKSGGLKKHLQQVKTLMPLDKIKEIIDGAANDPEIIALKEMHKSEEFRKKLQSLRSSQEYQLVKDYICKVLNLDLVYYKKLILTFFLPSNNLVKARDQHSSKGINNLLQKIYNILPRQELSDLYQSFLKTDQEFVKSIENIKSSDYLQLIENLKLNVKEYEEIRQQLMYIGVPMDKIQGFIRTILGWDLELVSYSSQKLTLKSSKY